MNGYFVPFVAIKPVTSRKLNFDDRMTLMNAKGVRYYEGVKIREGDPCGVGGV